MSYNFPIDESPIASFAEGSIDIPEDFQMSEPFTEQEFDATREGVVEDEQSDSTRGFHENLAFKLPDNELVSLAGELLEEVEDQISQKQEWESAIEIALQYLAVKIEEPQTSEESPIKMATAVDTTMSAALYRAFAIFKKELFPPEGPCSSQINGISTKEIEDMGERRRMFANYALTIEDRGYYPDSDDMLLTGIFMGSVFRKVFVDPITGKPKARFIKPQDFICDLNATSLLDSFSIGYRYPLSKREILERQETKDFIKFELGVPQDSETKRSEIDKTADEQMGINRKGLENKNYFEVHERHIYWNAGKLNGEDKLARNPDKLYPYLVTIINRKVVEIRRNWKESDAMQARMGHFVHYKYLPGIETLLGIGIAHLMAGNIINTTGMLKQMINKCALNTFPGGITTTTTRSEDNIKNPSPGEFLSIETGGQSLDEVFREMPYPPPSPIFLELLKGLQDNTRDLAGATDAQIPENSAQTPVGTTLAAVEIANRLQSASLSSFHNSLRYEFELIFDLWKDCLPDGPYPFKVPGYQGAILKKDFQDTVATVPVSDPNVLTSTHRLFQAEGLLKTAAQYPEIYNLKEVNRRMLTVMGVEDVDDIIPPDPEPMALDAVSENMMLLQGAPIVVAPFQNHGAHNMVHNIMLQQLEMKPDLMMANPAALFQLTLHIQQHSAAELVNQMRAGSPEQGLPPVPYLFQNMKVEQYLTIPDIQNQLSMINAQEAQQQIEQAQQAAQAQQEQASLPQQVMMEDINQRREAEQIRAEVAQMKIESEEKIAGLKAELESFKEQLKFESANAKIESEKELAREKAETDLALADIKQGIPLGQ